MTDSKEAMKDYWHPVKKLGANVKRFPLAKDGTNSAPKKIAID